jgi:hypothetical protein
MAASTTASPQPPARRRRGRRLLRWGIALAVLLLIAAVAIQFVLWSDYPRQLIVRQLQNQLGVRVELAEVRTGWFGRTQLRDLKLTMPLADEPFLRAPSVRVSHTGLLKLLIGRPLRIDSAEVDQPQFVVAQQPTGRWNVQNLGGSGNDNRASTSRSTDLPDLTLTNATLRIIDNTQRESVIQDIDFTGRNETAFVYAVDLTLPDYARVQGRLNLRDLDHRLQVSGRDLATPLKPLVPGLPRPLALEGEWIGQVRPDSLSALTHIRQLQAGAYNAEGDLRLELGRNGVVLRPAGLMIRGGAVPQAQASDGELQISGEAIAARALRIRTGEGDALINGQWRFDGGNASIDATWRDVELPAAVQHSGTLTARLEPQLGGTRRVSVNLDVAGKAPAAAFNTTFELGGEGRDWERMDWTFKADQLDVDAGEYSLDLDGLSAQVLGRGDRLVLHHLSLPSEGRLTGDGEFTLVGNRAWALRLSGSELPISRYRDLVARFDVRASGDQRRVNLNEVTVRAGELTATAAGFFDEREPEPLVLKLNASHPAPRDLVLADNPPLMGPLEAEASLRGTVSPLKLVLEGHATGRDLRTRKRTIGDVTLAFTGQVEQHQAQFSTTELELLGGHWRFGGTVEERPSGARDARLHVAVRSMPLDVATELFRFEGLSGDLTGGWTIDFPELNPEAMRVEGALTATDVVYRPTRQQPTTAPTAAPVLVERDQVGEPIVRLDRVHARTTMRDRVIRVEDLELQQQDGNARGGLVYRLAEPEVLRAEMTWSKWRLELPQSPASLTLYGKSGLLVNFEKGSVSGPIDLAADLMLRGQTLGEMSIAGEFRERGVNLPTIQADVFGGRVWGRLVFDLDQPLQSQGVLQFADIDGAAIAATWPNHLDGLAGAYRGVFEMRPADPENRPIAPLRLSGFIDPVEARFRGSDIGEITIDTYLDTRRSEVSDTPSRLRVILDNASIQAMGGRFDLWGRYTRHEHGAVSAQANVTFRDISLDQFWQTYVEPGDDPVPGLINGSATLLLDPKRPKASFGEADLRLTRSDLINVGAFTFLYNLLNVGTDTREPQGEGEVRLRLEGENVSLTRMNYFNRGVEVWALGQFTNVWAMPDSGVEATVVGTARPFRNLEIPLLADVQDILSILQRDLTTVRVSGTIDEHAIVQASFQQLGETMRNILVGDAQTKAKRK